MKYMEGTMIQKIRLNNFKCFCDSGEIEIKPLTVLCGINSSGKSTIIKSLLTLKQTHDKARNKQGLILNADYVKNGTFDDVVYKNTGDQFSIAIKHKIEKVTKFDKRSKIEITAFKNIGKMYSRYNKISDIMVSTIYTFSRKNNDNVLTSQEYDLDISYNDGHNVHSKVLFEHVNGSIWRIKLENFPNKNDELVECMTLKNATCYFENFIVANLYVDSTDPKTDEVVFIVNNICTISRYVGNLFQNVKYLTPLRVFPQRTYLEEIDSGEIGMGGENTAQFLSKYQEWKSFCGFAPIGIDNTEQSLNSYINQWLDSFGLGEYKINNRDEIVKLNIDSDNIINVGFGVSQTLPIIVSGLTMKNADMLLLEQPEIHLHPRAQMTMGDFLISMVKAKKNVIVETHSDHIINRIVKRVMDGTISEEDLAIYFVNNTPNGSEIVKIQIDMIKGVVNAPDEFFTQFASELNDIFKIGMENLKKTRK